MLIAALAFGCMFTGCADPEDDADVWSPVTSVNQLNGKWKGSYSETFSADEYYGEETGYEINITTTEIIEMDVNVSSNTVTVKYTQVIKFSGKDVNSVWELIKLSMGEDDDATVNDSDKSITYSGTESGSLSEFGDGGFEDLEINQKGNKLRQQMGDEEKGNIRYMIFNKQ